MLALRNSKPVDELNSLSAQISERLLAMPEVKNAQTISTYLHIGSEVRTNQIAKALLKLGKRVIVPITDRVNKRLFFSEVRNLEEELAPGTFGIPEPRREFRRLVPLQQAEVILVPGVAWDVRGYRIGYGVGFYDRSINSLTAPLPMIGLAYEFQIVERLPRSRYDRRVDKLVTERRVIDTESATVL